MTQVRGAEIYSAAELAQAAGVPTAAVAAALARGDLQFIAGTQFLAHAEAVRSAARLRELATEPGLTPDDAATRLAARFHAVRQALASSTAVHVTLLLVLVALTAGGSETAPVAEPVDTARLVFIISPGPGGGGGGGGQRSPVRAPRLQRRGAEPRQLSVAEIAPAPAPPTPAPPPPEPLPARPVVAPVVAAAADPVDADTAAKGPGMGEGQGSGIGEGIGGGTGGGPYRPGSGIEPPRLLREVKADYTDDARRRNLRGDVVLEIVVRRDGSVGDVTVLQGLGSGLDQSAVTAVRQWRFAPATRLGQAVDVIVEVAVEFNLR